MKTVQERLLVVAYTSQKCFFSARAAPVLEDINTKMVKYADFCRVDVDNPKMKSLCSEEVWLIENDLPHMIHRTSPEHRLLECIGMVRELLVLLVSTKSKFEKLWTEYWSATERIPLNTKPNPFTLWSHSWWLILYKENLTVLLSYTTS